MKQKLLIWLIKIFARLKISTTHKIAKLLGSFLHLLPMRENRIAKKNLKLVFTTKRADVYKQSVKETLKTLLETPAIWNLSKSQIADSMQTIIGKNLVDKNYKEKNGVIFAVPHIGSWEILGMWLPLHYPTISLYKNSDFNQIDKLVKESRSRHGAQLVPNTTKGVIALIRGLRSGKVTAILPDQDPGDNSGSVYVDFLGIPSKTSTLIPKLLQKTDAKLLIAYVIRLKNTKFKLVFAKPESAVYSPELKIATKALNREIEKIIMSYPEQHTWSYNRFKNSKI